jgi:hypothetical protein
VSIKESMNKGKGDNKVQSICGKPSLEKLPWWEENIKRQMGVVR